MTTGLWNATMGEQRGAVAPPADIDKYMVVMGPTSDGSVGLRGPYASARAIVSALGYGDTVDVAAQVVEQRQTNGSQVPSVPVCVYKVPATTPGAMGTINDDGVTGTAVPTADTSVTPFGTYRAAIKFVEGCTVGTAGGTYRASLEVDPDWSSIAPKRLGTATTIEIPNSGCKFILAPAASAKTALYTKVTLLQTTLTGTGHFTITSGSPAVHDAADTARDTALAAVPAATTDATCVTLFNACLSYLGLHGADDAVHVSPDTALATALAAIPVAVNVADVDLHLPALIAAYTAHRQSLTAHGSADGTNTITAYVAAPGTFEADDIFYAYTTAPQPIAADIDAAYVALSKSGKIFGLVAHAFDCTPTLAAHITTGLGVCQNTNRRMVALAHTDMPDLGTSETESDWVDSVETAFALGTVDDSRICMFSSFLHETDARTTSVYRRPGFAQFCADVVRVPMNEPPCAPVDQPATGLALWTSDDTQVGHDEGPRGDVTGLSNRDLGNRFVSTVSTEDPLRGNAVHYTVPWVLAAADDDIKTLMMRRIATSMERAAVSAAIGEGGAILGYTAPDPNVPGDVYRLTDVSRNMIHGVIFGALSEPYRDLIQNANDGDIESGLVWVNPVITVAPGKLVSVEYELRVQFQGVLMTLAGTFVVKE